MTAAAGVVAVVVGGTAWVVGRVPYPWAYVGGEVVELPVPRGWDDDAEATGVNGRGDVVGPVRTDQRRAPVV